MTIKDLKEVMDCEDFNDLIVLNPDDEYLCVVKKFTEVPEDIANSVVLKIVYILDNLMINVNMY